MKKILFQGDSITDADRSRGNRLSLGYGYPTQVAGLLGKEYPGQLEFVNLGISGNRVVDLYARIGEDFIEEAPDFITILIGINDVWHEFGARRNGIENPKFYKVYALLIEELTDLEAASQKLYIRLPVLSDSYKVQKIIQNYPGQTPIVLVDAKRQAKGAPRDWDVKVDEELMDTLKAVFGKENVILK